MAAVVKKETEADMEEEEEEEGNTSQIDSSQVQIDASQDDDDSHVLEFIGSDSAQNELQKNFQIQYDVSPTFNQIFGNFGETPTFDSWREFTVKLDAFQKKTGFEYKPKQANKIAYLNEKRTGVSIPERMVYASIKMVCVHFGNPTSNLGDEKKKKKNYVGKGCGAFIGVSFARGSLRLTKVQCLHTNHDPVDAKFIREHTKLLIDFTEDMDMTALTEVLRLNPYESTYTEEQWKKVLDTLGEEDPQFENVTTRMLKNRVRFLHNQFVSVTDGSQPPEEDKMGCLLYEIDQAKTRQKELKATPRRGRRKKIASLRVKALVGDDDNDNDSEDNSNSDLDEEYTPPAAKSKRTDTPTTANKSSSYSKSSTMKYSTKSKLSSHLYIQNNASSNSLTLPSLLIYLEKKDHADRQLREKEVDIRRQELILNRERFELDKNVITTTLVSMKSQIQALEQTVAHLQTTPKIDAFGGQTTQVIIPAPSAVNTIDNGHGQTTQYIIPGPAPSSNSNTISVATTTAAASNDNVTQYTVYPMP